MKGIGPIKKPPGLSYPTVAWCLVSLPQAEKDNEE